MFTSPSRTRQAATTALLALCAGISSSSAQSTWTSVTGNWSDASKWSPASVPVSGAASVLQFNQSASNYIATNDLTGNFELNRLIFSGTTTGGTTTLARNGTQSLAFSANGEVLPEIQFNATGNSRTVSIPLLLNADTTVTSSIADSANNLTFSGGLNGTGNFIVNYATTGTGVVVLNGSATNASTHAGTHLMSGTLAVASSANTPLGSGPLTLSGGRFFTTSGTANFTNTLNLAGNATVFRSSTALSMTFNGGGSIQGENVTRTLTLDRSGNVLTLGGAFTGSGNGLTLAGAGTLALGSGAADTAANTFDGTTTVTAATLSLNKADGTNAIAGNLAVSGGTVSWARSNQIANTSSLSQSGGTVSLALGLAETVQSATLTGGTFTVSKDATFTTTSLATTVTGTRAIGGVLEIGTGGLSISHDGNVSNRNAFTLYEGANTASGILRLGGDLAFANATASTSKVQITRSSGSGYIDLAGANRTFTINDGGAAEDLEITVRLSNGGLTKQGEGVLAFANTSSDYTGDTAINQGTIRVTSTTSGNQALSNQSTYVLANVAGVTLDLNNNNQSVGGLSGGGSTGGSVLLGTGTLTVGNNDASTTYGGEISGTGGLTKTGAGALTLSSNLGYTGATLVSEGALVIDGQLASSGVTLDGATAILAGSGRVNGLTLTQGTFGPGNSPGVFTVDGNVSFGAASVFAIEIGSVSSFDQLVVNGGASTVNIEAGASIVLPGFESLTAFDTGTEFIFIDNQSANPITGSFLGYDEGQSFVLGANTFTASYQLGAGGNDFGFTVTAIPEPSAFGLLAGFASLAFVARRRTR